MVRKEITQRIVRPDGFYIMLFWPFALCFITAVWRLAGYWSNVLDLFAMGYPILAEAPGTIAALTGLTVFSAAGAILSIRAPFRI